MNNFNFTGFLIAHQRGKKLSKSKRNRNSLLAAVIPGDNFSGILTPLALTDKEVAEKEKTDANSELNQTRQLLASSGEFILKLHEDKTEDEQVENIFMYLQHLNPKFTQATLAKSALLSGLPSSIAQKVWDRIPTSIQLQRIDINPVLGIPVAQVSNTEVPKAKKG